MKSKVYEVPIMELLEVAADGIIVTSGGKLTSSSSGDGDSIKFGDLVSGNW